MFLNQLKTKNKERFLELCLHASLSNDNFDETEKYMMNEYCVEMGIEKHIPEVRHDLKELLSIIDGNTDLVEKKIILLELLALVKSDSVFDEEEQIFINEVINAFSISGELYQSIESLLEIYTSVYNELTRVIYA